MALRNMELDYITDDYKRKAAFRKRKHGIIKKLDELTTLCGIDVCGIIYHETKPEAISWPSKNGVQTLLDKFKSIPESQQRKMMMDLEDFLKQAIVKEQEKLMKQKEINKKKEMDYLLGHFIQTGEFDGNDLSESDLEDLSLLVNKKLKEVDQMMK